MYEPRLVLAAIGEVIGFDRERAHAGRDEPAHQADALLEQLRVVREIEERRIDLVTDAGDELAERRHLLGLDELHLRLLEVRQRARELVRALGDALLERLVESRELFVRAVDLAVAAMQ